jgi:hypothetical protein
VVFPLLLRLFRRQQAAWPRGVSRVDYSICRSGREGV